MSEIDLRTRRFLELSMRHCEQKRILQEFAIKRENERRLRRALLRNGALFVIAAVSLFSLIWWFGL